MPLTLDFQISPSWNREPLDLAKADEVVLRYDVPLGDVVFRIDTFDASARWGWVPLLDFALAFDNVIDELLVGTTRSMLDFTESDAEIYFRREDDRIVVSSNFSDGEGRTTLQELRNGLRDFSSRLKEELLRRWPGLRHNSVFVGMGRGLLEGGT